MPGGEARQRFGSLGWASDRVQGWRFPPVGSIRAVPGVCSSSIPTTPALKCTCAQELREPLTESVATQWAIRVAAPTRACV